MFLLQAVQYSGASTGEFLLSLCTTIGTVGVVGFLFWTWLNAKFSYQDKTDAENRARIIQLEKSQADLLSKDDHYEIRKEDKDGLEKQMGEMKKDIKDMPEKIVNMLKPFLK